MSKFSQVVKKYRDTQQLSLRKFAEQISDGLQIGGISHQTVKDWEDGENPGNVYFFLGLSMEASDWRQDFAFDCLAAIRPEYYKPVSRLAREVLEAQHGRN